MPSFYIVTLKHDAGILRLGVAAPNRRKAIQMACLAEHAPLSAVLACIKKAQKRRTK
jgi:hypothetical protein